MAEKPSLLEELKRRRVFRAAGVYGVVAFVVAQAAELLFPALLLPEWTVRFLVALLLLGFPVALVLAWSFDLTPEGVRRTPGPEPHRAGDAEPPEDGTSAGAADRAATAEATRANLPFWSPHSAGLVGVGMVIALVAFGGYHFIGQPSSPGDSPAAGAPSEAGHSIAVLPFTTMAGGEENEFFADGLTEDILTNLGLVPDFTVISRTSVMRYKGSDKSIPEIARELGVRYVLEGSMRRAGDQVRVVIQLIEPGTDTQIWARTMDRRVEDVFALQSEIAHAVVDALRVELGRSVGDRIRRAPTEDIAAYELFLHGRDFYYQYTRPAMERAIDMFQDAVERDSTFALAHAWLGAARAVCVFNYACDPSLLESAVASARRAVELQPDLGDGHRALGTAHAVSGRLDDAVPSLERAIELNPNDFSAIGNLGLVHSLRGDLDRSIEVTRRSIERDPVRSYIAYGNLASSFRVLGMYDRARASATHALALRMEDPNAGINLALTDLMEGRTAEAVARMEQLAGEHADPSVLGSAGYFFAVLGNLARARELLERAHAQAPDAGPTGGHAPAVVLAYLLQHAGEVDRAAAILAESERTTRQDVDRGHQVPTLHYSLAGIAAIRGWTGEALDHLERAVDRGYNEPDYARNDPIFEGLRDEPRFRAAIERMEERNRAQRQRVEQAGW
jgi:TolB-like protein/Tfp pilus assembly protein PilF